MNGDDSKFLVQPEKNEFETTLICFLLACRCRMQNILSDLDIDRYFGTLCDISGFIMHFAVVLCKKWNRLTYFDGS
jgi:hypothetical protein